MKLIYPQKSPDRLLPTLARLYGIECDPMLIYCTTVPDGNKLPRGLQAKLEKLRVALKVLISIKRGKK